MKVFKTLQKETICQFDLSANSPLIIADNRTSKIDVTSANITFFKGKDNSNQDTYIIPGSSIKGVFRHYFYDHVKDDVTNNLFGNISKDNINKGKIKFNDAYADMSTIKTTIRYNTAINKISQSAQNSSLNSIETVIQGDFKSGFKITNFTNYELETILKAMLSINDGELSFGGRTSRGFGRMLIKNFRLVINNGYNKDFIPNIKEFNTIESVLKYLCMEDN